VETSSIVYHYGLGEWAVTCNYS